MANNLILNIPFGETSGNTAVDLASGKNARLTGGQFVAGRSGKAAYFAGSGQAEIIGPVNGIIPLTGTYTFCCWLLAKPTVGAPNDTWVLVKFAGVNNYLYIDLHTDLTSWTYLVLIQDTGSITVNVNSRTVGSEVFPPGWGQPTGFCVLNDNPGSGGGYSTIEDLTVYQGIASGEIIQPPLAQMDLNYFINEQNFKNYGVYVSDSDGIIDNLTMKDPFKVEWDDYHGEVIDLTRPRYQPRDITLTCFIEGVGKDEFLDHVRNFLSLFTQAGTQRLRLSVHSTKPLVYEVYLKDSVNLKKKWSDALMVGTFELKLREPEPVKRVLQFGAGTVSITLSSSKMVNIYWGDGQKTKDVYGTNVTVTHTYADAVDHYIIIAGVIEDIYGFTTTAAIVWNKL